MSENTSFSLRIPLSEFKEKSLRWANQFPSFLCLDSNEYGSDKYQEFEYLLAIDTVRSFSVEPNTNKAFDVLKNAVDQQKEQWLFGYLGYDLKNSVERLSSNNPTIFPVAVKDFLLFEPRYVITIKDGKVSFNRSYPEAFNLLDAIEQFESKVAVKHEALRLNHSISKDDYCKNVTKIREHIIEGDIYEMNYCTEFRASHAQIDPIKVFGQLNAKSQAPFASLFKDNGFFAIGASMERFLKKTGNQLISQPIKGTIRKSEDEVENEQLKQQLSEDIKERAENVMIVDLVRNDLTRSSKTGSIKVPELFEVYEFGSINQMISTVTSELREEVHPVDAIKYAFPPGSMTGAPKIRAMELIEQFEDFKRGFYSGSVGYFNPNGDFDFNVVIRTVLYDSNTGEMSLPVGGAITYDSVPEREYEEILTKAEAILQILAVE